MGKLSNKLSRPNLSAAGSVNRNAIGRITTKGVSLDYPRRTRFSDVDSPAGDV